MARPRAQGQAMISTATPAVNAVARVSPVPTQKPTVPSARPMTTGTNTAEIWSASRWTGALPFWASVTSRAICARAVSAPTRVARTTRRPPALTVAPVTGSPGPTSTGTGSPVSREASIAEVPVFDDAVGGDLLAGADDEQVADDEVADRDPDLVAVTEDGDVLRAQVEQGSQCGAGGALGAGFEVAAGEDEHDDDAGHLEVQLGLAGTALEGEREAHLHAGDPGVAPEQGVDAPTERGERADRDEGVHGGGTVAQVLPRRPVERVRRPQHDRGGQREREPLPVLELQGVDHRQQQDGDAEHRGDDEPVAQRGELRISLAGVFHAVAGVGLRCGGDLGGVADRFDLGDDLLDGDAVGDGDGGLFGGVVHGWRRRRRAC